MAAEDPDPTFVEFTRQQFGDSLRTVVRHRVEEVPIHDLEYIRDDIESELEPELEDHVSELAREFVLESLEREWHENLHRSGSFRGTIRMFDDAAEIRVYEGDCGFSISVDIDAVVEFDDFFEQAESYLPTDE